MDEENIDEFNFQVEEADKMVMEIIDTTLSGKPYNEAEVPHWINTICEKTL
jgi:hypothetical protein